jgi:putative peptidoglycan lipid II flippase
MSAQRRIQHRPRHLRPGPPRARPRPARPAPAPAASPESAAPAADAASAAESSAAGQGAAGKAAAAPSASAPSAGAQAPAPAPAPAPSSAAATSEASTSASDRAADLERAVATLDETTGSLDPITEPIATGSAARARRHRAATADDRNAGGSESTDGAPGDGSAGRPTVAADRSDDPNGPGPSAAAVGSEGSTGPDASIGTSGSAEDEAPKPTGTRARLMRATAVMALGSTVSRALGFVRNFLFGAMFLGISSSVGSAFSSANVVPNTIWIMIGGGTLNAILVPAIVRAAKQPDRGSDFTSRLFTLVTVVAGGVTVLAMVLAPLLMVLTNGSLPPDTYALAVQLVYWMMPQILFSALYLMLGQLLNAHDSFGPYQWAPVLNNLVAIVGALIFLAIWGRQGDPTAWTLPMVIALAAMNVGGSAIQVVFLGYYVHKLGLKLRPRWGFRGLGLGKLSRIGMWSLGMLIVGQLALYAGRWSVGGAVHAAETNQGTDASRLYPGLGTMDWAYTVFMIPQGILAVTLVTAAFPSISRSASEGDHERALHRYQQTNRILAVPMMLCAAVFIALAGPIMWVIDGGSSVAGAQASAWVLAAYMLGLVPFSANYLTKRAFYAYEDARAPFWMQIPTSALPLLGVVPVLLFVDPHWQAATAALVVSLGNVVGWAYGQWMLRRHARQLGATLDGGRTALLLLGRLLAAAVIAYLVGDGLVALMGGAMWMNRILTVVLGVVVGVVTSAVFVAVAWALRVEELRSLVAMVRARMPGGGRRSAGTRSM